ncbi:MAG: hypothetical protein OFPI_18220 [Osedax symbiont Rs2]|nr:MAG: hypothetical protein OFPI_18220 [Osedax symbiont Rs2]
MIKSGTPLAFRAFRDLGIDYRLDHMLSNKLLTPAGKDLSFASKLG